MVRRIPIRARVAATLLAVAMPALAGVGQAGGSQTTVVLDRVVAVVNRQAILSSDIDEEIRLSVLDASRSGNAVYTRKQALDRLISRTLIQQQIRHDDMDTAEPTEAEVKARVSEIRRVLPECVHKNCASDEEWETFLASHGLTQEMVSEYFRNRMEILNFIEQRFRSGIHIPPQDVENYYRNTLLPQYKPGESVPSFENVAPRIEEILLQQQLTAMFDEWLTNLHSQGDVEILDPSLEGPPSQAAIRSGTPSAVKKEDR